VCVCVCVCVWVRVRLRARVFLSGGKQGSVPDPALSPRRVPCSVTKRGDTAPTEGSEAMKADFTVKRLRQILCTHDIDTDNVGTTALHDIDLFERLNKFMIFKPEINATCIISACWAVPAGLDDEKAELAAANYTPYLVGERTLAATAAKVNPAARLTVLQTAFGGLSYNVRLHLDRPTTVTADSPPIIMSTVLTPLATVVKESTKVLSHKELATLMLSKDMGAKMCVPAPSLPFPPNLPRSSLSHFLPVYPHVHVCMSACMQSCE